MAARWKRELEKHFGSPELCDHMVREGILSRLGNLYAWNTDGELTTEALMAEADMVARLILIDPDAAHSSQSVQRRAITLVHDPSGYKAWIRRMEKEHG